jgi:hypothetical protein
MSVTDLKDLATRLGFRFPKINRKLQNYGGNMLFGQNEFLKLSAELVCDQIARVLMAEHSQNADELKAV